MSKWYWIVMGIFLVFMGLSTMFSDYVKGQCRTEAIKAGKTTDEIQKICK